MPLSQDELNKAHVSVIFLHLTNGLLSNLAAFFGVTGRARHVRSHTRMYSMYCTAVSLSLVASELSSSLSVHGIYLASLKNHSSLIDSRTIV